MTSDERLDRLESRMKVDDLSKVYFYVTETTEAEISKHKRKGTGFGKRFRIWSTLSDFNNAQFLVEEQVESRQRVWETMTVGNLKVVGNRRRIRVTFVHPDPKLSIYGETCVHTTDVSSGPILTHSGRVNANGIGNYTGDHFSSTVPDPERPDWLKSFPTLLCSSLYCFPDRETYLLCQSYSRAGWWSESEKLHPLVRQIGIPYSKIEREKLGLMNDQALIKDVPVAGGKLTLEFLK